MIAALRGTLEARAADAVVVAVGGLSLRLLVPASTLARLGAVGESVRLQTHLHLRPSQDVVALYGFATPEELELFELLITVTGVGPRLALALLSGAPVESLRQAIGAGNADRLTAVPGIGKKLAGRIVLELKGKVDARGAPDVAAAGDAEVLAALTGLGYSVADAQRAIQSLPAEAPGSVEERIVLALRHFQQR